MIQEQEFYGLQGDFFIKNRFNESLKHEIIKSKIDNESFDISKYIDIKAENIGECVLLSKNIIHDKSYFKIINYLTGVLTSIENCKDTEKLLHEYDYKNVTTYCKDPLSDNLEDFKIYEHACRILTDEVISDVEELLDKHNIKYDKELSKINKCIILYQYLYLFRDRD
jgi:hypothetical protein